MTAGPSSIRRDPLTPKDTNRVEDVYEYVDGRPQLITTGTNSVHHPDLELPQPHRGFEGVSADGLDVYFSTYDTLVGQDHNGEYLKFYDARTRRRLSLRAPRRALRSRRRVPRRRQLPADPPAIVSGDELGKGGNAPAAAQEQDRRSQEEEQQEGQAEGTLRAHRAHTHGRGGTFAWRRHSAPKLIS